ncbi:hypothetical protein D3C78_1915240 [compost metagenome]
MIFDSCNNEPSDAVYQQQSEENGDQVVDSTRVDSFLGMIRAHDSHQTANLLACLDTRGFDRTDCKFVGFFSDP